ncbi:hypothetical protein HDU92_008689, partial [Lobulomyces angularis]
MPGLYVFPGAKGDMSIIVTPEEVVIIDGTEVFDALQFAWIKNISHLPKITKIIITHHDKDHVYGIELLLAKYFHASEDDFKKLPSIENLKIYMNFKRDIRVARNQKDEFYIKDLIEKLNEKKVNLNITKSELTEPKEIFSNEKFTLESILPTIELIKSPSNISGKTIQKCYLDMKKNITQAVSLRGGATAANVFSICLVLTKKNFRKKSKHYLFTGDSHLLDLSAAAKSFLERKHIPYFEYMDIPHHGSANSNVYSDNKENTIEQARNGFSSFKSRKYVLSHNGGPNGNKIVPKFITITTILQEKHTYSKLYFLTEKRKKTLNCTHCRVDSTNWVCNCPNNAQKSR